MNDYQALVNPPPFMMIIKGLLFYTRPKPLQLTKSNQYSSKDMTTQPNREVLLQAHQQVETMPSHLRDFTRINPPAFYVSKIDEDPK